MLKQLILIAPLLVQVVLAAPGVEPRHQHLHGSMEHTHGRIEDQKMTTSVRQETKQTAAPRFIPPKMPHAPKPDQPNQKVQTTKTAESPDSKETVVPQFIPPKMPFVSKTFRKQQTNKEKPGDTASIASVKNKKVKVENKEDDNENKLPTFIPPRAPFRGPRKPQQTQPTGDLPRDTLPEFIPPRNPWPRHNTRSVDSDDQDSQGTITSDSKKKESNKEPASKPSHGLEKREEDEEEVVGEDEFFGDDSDFDSEAFPHLAVSEDDEPNNSSTEEPENTPTEDVSQNIPTDNDSEGALVDNGTGQTGDKEEAVDGQEGSSYRNHFGGDFDDDDDDANDSPTRLEVRGTGKRNMLYFTNWGIYKDGANFQPKNIPVKEITHILYSFAKVSPKDGTVASSDSYADTNMRFEGDSWNDAGNNVYGCVKQLYLLKKKNRNLKVLLSIGGWNGSPDLASGVRTQAGQNRFIATAVKLITDWGFDGIDVDWEYPANAQEAQTYIKLLAGLRQALDKHSTSNKLNYHFLLTVATSATSNHYNIMNMRGMDRYLDGWHLMAYDYAGPWDTTTAHHANVYLSKPNPLSTKFSTDKAVSDYIASGVAPNKILMGMPLYGRSFAKTDGLGKPFQGVGGGSLEPGMYSLKNLPRPGATTQHDTKLMTAITYDKNKRELVTFDDVTTGKLKAGYINQRGLGGAFYWEASGDKLGSGSVVAAVKRTMGSIEQSTNLLKYPTSVYANMRAGMP
ncbi:hypothetical protein F66182_4343 [Fusarium sp. NRRL 66182]|nr:hypothetical protein F66182_4343 [Fusarium sp. NRRL 66182]